MSSGNSRIDARVESLCDHGCRAVREYIEALRSGQELPQYADLNAQERALLQRELEIIMAVYDRDCRL